MATEGLTYTQYVSSLTNPQAVQYMLDLETAVNNGQISQYEFSQAVESVTGKSIKPHRAYNGDILGYTLETVETATTNNPINSNASTVSRGTIARPITSTVNQGGKAVIQGLRGVGAKAATGAALVGTAATCVGVGIALGKTIDSALYNLNPDFWDSNNMSTLNPETWSSITAGEDSLGATLLNVLFGFDTDGKAQAYIDETAFAYMSMYMQNRGVFEQGAPSCNPPQSVKNQFPGVRTYPILLSSGQWRSFDKRYSNDFLYEVINNSQPVYQITYWRENDSLLYCLYFSLGSFSVKRLNYKDNPPSEDVELASQKTVSGLTFYAYQNRSDCTPLNNFESSRNKLLSVPLPIYINNNNQVELDNVEYIVLTNDVTPGETIEGIGDQDGATLPDTSTWDTIPNTLSSLQSQYPDLWNNAIDYPVIQDDGSVKNYTYLPIPLPDFTTRTDDEPVSGDSTQTDTEINPSILPEEFIDYLTKILTNPMPETEEDLDNDNPPENPTDTGDGSSPVPIVPVGSASALWKIYHPTQAQIDSFGGWLWSSNFIDQILKIFNNPMEAVIGLHKVYATPIDAGNTTIKVGYLDSQVPSAYIEQQYIDVDCGSVNLAEQFGNVFDYSPFTDVQLYLPFVGIVPLNVADVMRATISIKYGVDVITGACLAQVKVSRDNNSSILYQYSGNCAVQYPISSGSYMGIVSSIISVAGGIAATVATGGGAAPLALGAAGGLLNAHTSVQHSGSFSGNAGAMGGKIPYLIITRPQTKVAHGLLLPCVPSNSLEKSS